MVFLDETWASTARARSHGRAPGGQRLRMAIPHGHWKTATFVAGLTTRGLAAPWVLDGAINQEACEAYVAQVLVPELRPGDTVVPDHLSSHKAPKMRQLIEAAGALLPRPQPSREGLRQARGAAAQGGRTDRHRPLGRHRPAPRPLHPRQVPELLHRRSIPCKLIGYRSKDQRARPAGRPSWTSPEPPMSRLLQRTATPLVTGFFLVSLISGLALFFHVGAGTFHAMHEWLSLVLILPFGLHVWKNCRLMAAYLRGAPMLASLAVATLAALAFAWPAAIRPCPQETQHLQREVGGGLQAARRDIAQPDIEADPHGLAQAPPEGEAQPGEPGGPGGEVHVRPQRRDEPARQEHRDPAQASSPAPPQRPAR